jgi:hypothetical protein
VPVFQLHQNSVMLARETASKTTARIRPAQAAQHVAGARRQLLQRRRNLFRPFFAFVNDKRAAVGRCWRRGKQGSNGFDFGGLDGLTRGCFVYALQSCRCKKVEVLNCLLRYVRDFTCLPAFVFESGASRR